ncbi:hypothetical protein ILUMI_25192 [Ignelater luminosus]|uniref:Uncharacterized protein n=1 Tax=Ignelater luminosus TaxID=2038154 RepID=A0A8K0C911_IGNLU|nr:hypothetical protein ILUMI_25192 [Ignelater luminosus]
MLLTAFSLTMLATSVSMGLIHKARIKCDKKSDPPKLLKNNYQKMLNETLFNSISLFDTNYKQQAAWNKIQQRLKCCGSYTYKDWINIGTKVPSSCCENSMCETGKLYTEGCLCGIVFDILWQISFISGLSSIVFAVQLFTLCMASYMYIKGKLQTQASSVSIHVS